jgi:hypothetical protein
MFRKAIQIVTVPLPRPGKGRQARCCGRATLTQHYPTLPTRRVCPQVYPGVTGCNPVRVLDTHSATHLASRARTHARTHASPLAAVVAVARAMMVQRRRRLSCRLLAYRCYAAIATRRKPVHALPEALRKCRAALAPCCAVPRCPCAALRCRSPAGAFVIVLQLACALTRLLPSLITPFPPLTHPSHPYPV